MWREISMYNFILKLDIVEPYIESTERFEPETSWSLSLHFTNELKFQDAAAFRRAQLSNWHWDILVLQLLIKHQPNRSFC